MDLDDLFSKIEKKSKTTQNPETSKQKKQTQEKIPHSLKLKLNHEINRLELCKLTPENLYQTLTKQPQNEQFVNELMEAQLIEMVGDQNLFEDKIKHKSFLIGKFEKPFQLKNAADTEQQQPMKNNLNRQMKIFKRSLLSLTYKSVLDLHNLWKVYIEDLLSKEKQQDSKFIRLLKADLHGAFIQIVYAKCKTYEGQEGIVVREKKKSFIIMKENNKSITIEKENTIFLLPIGKQTYRLHGCHLLMKAAERVRRDIKYHAANTFCYQQM